MSAFPISGPLTLGDLLDRTFRLYRARFGLFVRTAALFLVPLALASALLTGSSETESWQLLAGMVTGDVTAQPTSGGGATGWVFLLGIVSIFVNGLVVLSLARQNIDALHGESQPLGQSVRMGWKRLWTYARMIFLQGLVYGAVTAAVMIVLGIIFFLLVAVVGVIGFNSNLDSLFNFDNPAGFVASIGAGIFLICGYILAVLLVLTPTIYFAARWIVAMPVLLDGEWRAREALRRSWALTQGQIWRVIGYSVLLWVLGFLFVSLPVILAQTATAALVLSEQQFLAVALSAAVSTLFSVLWVPLNTSALVLLYYDLRVRKESYDLDLRIDQMAAGVAEESEKPDTDFHG